MSCSCLEVAQILDRLTEDFGEYDHKKETALDCVLLKKPVSRTGACSQADGLLTSRKLATDLVENSDLPSNPGIEESSVSKSRLQCSKAVPIR